MTASSWRTSLTLITALAALSLWASGCVTDGLEGKVFSCTSDGDCLDGFCDRGGACREAGERGTYCASDADCTAGTCSVAGLCTTADVSVDMAPDGADVDTVDTSVADMADDDTNRDMADDDASIDVDVDADADVVPDTPCADTNSDPLHCGECGNVCPAGAQSEATCSGGVCGLSCDAGWVDCNDDPDDGCETRFDCAPIVRVSVDSDDVAWEPESFDLSGDGRVVVVDARPTRVMSGDPFPSRDVFVHDRQAQTTARATLSPTGGLPDKGSEAASVSADGTQVAFQSDASNLVAFDFNDRTDIFVRDLDQATTERVSLTSAGDEVTELSFSPLLSGDGRLVFFTGVGGDLVGDETLVGGQLYVHDRDTDTVERIAPGGLANFSVINQSLSVSHDGRLLAFHTEEPLVVDDTNDVTDVYVYDRQSGSTTRVSVAADGTQADGDSTAPVISADGRVVLFQSNATNLLTEPVLAGGSQVYRVDVVTGEVTLVSLGANGQPDYALGQIVGGLSADGRYATFTSAGSNLIELDFNGVADVFLFDAQAAPGSLTRLSVAADGTEANGDSTVSRLSADGRFAAFLSDATNLVTGEDTNTFADLFVVATGVSEPSVAGAPLMACGADELLCHARGCVDATTDTDCASCGNVCHVVGSSCVTGTCVCPPEHMDCDGTCTDITTRTDCAGCGNPCPESGVTFSDGQCSPSGCVLTCSSGLQDCNQTAVDGCEWPWATCGQLLDQGNSLTYYEYDVSHTGRFVALTIRRGPAGGNLHHVFVRDQETGLTTQVDLDSMNMPVNANSRHVSISGDGRYVAFSSTAVNLSPDDTTPGSDIYVRDLQSGTVTLASVGPNGISANAQAYWPELSDDGRYVAFVTSGVLEASDTDPANDIYVRDLQLETTTLVSIGLSSSAGAAISERPAISADGRYVAFAHNGQLDAADDDSQNDVYLRDTQLDVTTMISVDSDGNNVAEHAFRPHITADGRDVYFFSQGALGTDGIPYAIYVRDTQTHTTTLVSRDNANSPVETTPDFSISTDGRFLAFTTSVSIDPADPSDFNVYVRDLQTGVTELIEVPPPGVVEETRDPSISRDGRFVALESNDNVYLGLVPQLVVP